MVGRDGHSRSEREIRSGGRQAVSQLFLFALRESLRIPELEIAADAVEDDFAVEIRRGAQFARHQQTPGVVELNVTSRPDVAVAETLKSPLSTRRSAIGSNVIV